MSRSRVRGRPRKNAGLAVRERPYGRDLLVSGVIGGLISTRVTSWKGVLLAAVVTELSISLVSYLFPTCWPPDKTHTLAHKTAGMGAFMAGWYVGRVVQNKPVDGG